MIYLDHAATSMPKPPAVIEAVADAMRRHGNPARGAHAAAMTALRTTLAARTAVSEMFGVGDPARVIFTSGATMALNIAIAGLDGRIVTTAAEHNSVSRPLHRRGDFSIVPVDSCGRLDFNRLEDELRRGAGALVMTHASNLCGNVYDIAEAGGMCCRFDIPFIVDAAQTAGLLPIDMEKFGIDALCFSGHKALYGPQGIGCLCLGPDFSPPPLIVGGSGSDSFSPTQPADPPDSLEAGTLNSHGIAGLLAGINHVRGLDGRQFAEADALARMFADRVGDCDGVILYGDYSAPLRIPVVALNLLRVDAARAAALLDERHGIAVRAGGHCTPWMHRSFGTEDTGSLRFSFAHTNTADEVSRAVEALEEIAE